MGSSCIVSHKREYTKERVYTMFTKPSPAIIEDRQEKGQNLTLQEGASGMVIE